jgi:iron complex transport system ATP-binding protein
VKLEVKDGAFSYGKRVIFEEIDFSVREREILAILGPNGSGKTTLLKCVMNMLPWQRGAAFLDGVDAGTIPVRQFWQSLSWVPQGKSPAFGYSVEDMILLGRSVHVPVFSNPGQNDYRIVKETMKELNIERLAKQDCNTLSGGELQLVMIGRALASRPGIIIMDEPESGLDFRNQLMIINLVKRLSRNTACIINTHYPEHARRIADKVILLNGKGGVLYGDCAAMINEENLRDIFGVEVIIGKTERGAYPYIVPAEISYDPYPVGRLPAC